MTHNHSQGHHGHEHGTGNYNRAFVIDTVLNMGFVIVEAVYGQGKRILSTRAVYYQ